MAVKRRHFYWIESNPDNTVQLNRATLTDAGWQETGTKKFDRIEDARAVLPPGLVRSYPSGYGGSRTLEYWEEPGGH